MLKGLCLSPSFSESRSLTAMVDKFANSLGERSRELSEVVRVTRDIP